MSFNPNRATRERIWWSLENLYESLKHEGITLKGLELSKPLMEDGEPLTDIPLTFGLGYNNRHVKVTVKEKKV